MKTLSVSLALGEGTGHHDVPVMRKLDVFFIIQVTGINC